MKSLINLLVVIAYLMIGTTEFAQIKNKKTEIVTVYGNCDMCKKSIETAAYSKKISEATWNKDNKTASLSFDSTKTTSDAILKKIALAGYDNQNYLAPDQAYNQLKECCQYKRKNGTTSPQNNPHASMPNMENMKTDDMQSMQAKEKNILAPVYDAYFGIKDALVKGDGTMASSKAKELFKAVDAVPMEKLASAQHMAWMKYMKDISYNAEHIKGTTEIDHQREHFTKLSVAMYEVMKVIKADYPVYYDHCPMYNDGKGADWLSKESGIKNPYYGSQMLTCGSTKETIK